MTGIEVAVRDALEEALGELEEKPAKAAKPVKVKIAKATASFEQQGYPIRNALDGKATTD